MLERQRQYTELLGAHLQRPLSENLAAAYSFGRQCADQGVPAAALIAMHFQALVSFAAAGHDQARGFFFEVARGLQADDSPSYPEDLLTGLYETGVKHLFDTAGRPGVEPLIHEKLLALKAAEERFEILVQTIPDIIYKIDAQGNFAYLNTAITDLGYDPDELIGKHFSAIILPAELELMSAAAVLPRYAGRKTGAARSPKLFDERRSGERKTTGLEVRLLLKSAKASQDPGEPLNEAMVIVEINSSGLHEIDPASRAREFAGTVGVIRDITLRKKAEAELRQYQYHLEELVAKRTIKLSETNKALQNEIGERQKSEKFSKDILNSMGEGLVVLDRHYRIITANNAYARQVKKSLAEIIGQPCYAVSHKISRPCHENGVECPVSLAFTTSLPHTAIHQHIDQDGNLYHVEIKSYPMKDATGRVISAIEIIRDISEQKKLEGQLRHAQKMEAIATLAGGIAHDFNNILTGILGYTELALLRTDKTSQLYLDLEEVQKAGKRATELVKQILTISRQRERQERQPIQISPIVKEVLKLLRASLPSTIEIRSQIDKTRDLVEMDPTHVHQLLMNLCTNAAAAMQEHGGLLEVRLTGTDRPGPVEIMAGLRPAGKYVKLSVRDTGHGMTPEIMERIYDPYFTTKEKGKGTGLGLAMVRGIVNSGGGQIIAESEVGKGSTFHVILPALQQRKTVVTNKAAPPPFGHERLLFIDDEPAVVAVAKRLLEGLGYEVITQTDPVAALQLFQEQPDHFDLVITDYTMPLLPGDSLAREILAVRPEMPIILCTGFSHQISEEKAKKLGIKAFAMKPLTSRELATTIRTVLDS